MCYFFRKFLAFGRTTLVLWTIFSLTVLFHFKYMKSVQPIIARYLSTPVVLPMCHHDHIWTNPVDNWTLDQIANFFEWPNSSACRFSQDFGGIVVYAAGLDGQKAVCMDPLVRPKRASEAWPVTVQGFSECLVYSFGINNEWSFDEAMEDLGCRVYAFDPSMKLRQHDHSPKIHFYSIGLHNFDTENFFDKVSNNSWTMKTLDSIYYNLLRHKGKIIDYLKIDIEHGEWIVLPQILSSGMMHQVRQLGVEIHMISPSGNDRLDDIRQRVKVLKLLEDYGLVRFDSKVNPWSKDYKVVDETDWLGYNSYEIAWYNSNLLRKNNSENQVREFLRKQEEAVQSTNS